MEDQFTQALLTEFIRLLCIHDKEFGTYYSYYLLDAQSDLKVLAQLLGQSISHVQTKEYEDANDKHSSRRTSRDTE
jgi:hypothetical protein